ncbi:hypothetical protein CICLE_v10009874mg [Citrus x clementina]|uniref:Endoplasmic reticulum transmembrane protein n=1 Tax=Citrus clementina TaxID=85681 RepID=V4UHT0_CITCL|nr:hypothetical protein CICLE_v10009874mg [Citrus x clementina]
MIYLLFKIVFTEMALILTLLFRNPLRKFVIMGLDRLKRGRGPLVAKSVGATVLVVLCSAVYSAMEIQRRAREGGAINPTEEVLMANLLLQASLMGFSLFLAVMMDRLHSYIKRKQILEEVINPNKQHNQ